MVVFLWTKSYSSRMVRFLGLLFIMATLLFTVGGARAADLKIMAEEYPPYSYRLAGKPAGLVVDLVYMIHEQMGEDLPDIKFYPWARGYKNLLSGVGDALFPMAMTPERSGLFKFVGPVLWDDIYFYRKKGVGVEISCVDDAKKVKKIAVTRDDVFHKNLIGMGFTNLDISSSQKSDFLKLLKGRVDLVPMGCKSYCYFMKKYPELNPDDYERVGPTVFFTTAYIAFNKNTPDSVIEKWQKALDELKAQGRWLEIVEEYFPPEAIDGH